MTEESLARALGDLQGTVRELSEQWHRQDEAATAGRRGLYERFERLSDQVLLMSHALNAVTEDVGKLRADVKNDIMPTIDMYRLEVARRLGILWAGRMMWTALIGIAGAIGFAVHEIVQFFTKR